MQMLGEVLIGALVIHVHHRILKDRQIDEPVLQDIRMEQYIGAVGLVMIVAGYGLQVGVMR